MKKNKFQLKREATYEKLMAAGLEVFCEKGFSSTTIDEISSKAGYSRGAFYVQFESKEDFFRKLIEYRREMRADTQEQLERLFDSGAGLQETVSFLAEGLVTYIKRSPEWIFVYIDYFMQTEDKDFVRELFKSYYESWIAETKGNLDWLCRKGLIPEEANTIENAKQIYAILDGYITHHNLYGEALDGLKLTEAMLKLLR
ncbi:TetR/AcrR family transcriptional regulator [Paenibacillus sp. IITD108]|uniref:TetR/AcrR family transcriptional regulator n=1 Tax=Paenibacillus sp. IITD108 TaxID=3116649 RepID=UPI002F4063D5